MANTSKFFGRLTLNEAAFITQKLASIRYPLYPLPTGEKYGGTTIEGFIMNKRCRILLEKGNKPLLET